jgi:hypothetical protein
MGLSGEKYFQNYLRVLNRAFWSSLEASHILVGLLIHAFALRGPVILGLDDTIGTTDDLTGLLLAAPKRFLVVVADSSFAVNKLLWQLHQVKNPVCMITRFRLEAALDLFAQALEAGCHGCLMGRNVTQAPDPEGDVAYPVVFTIPRLGRFFSGRCFGQWRTDQSPGKPGCAGFAGCRR